MRAAPPVSVRCSGGGPWRTLRVGLQALAAAAVAAWVFGHAGLAVAWGLLLVPAVMLAAWRPSRQESVVLNWDGQHWTADGVPGALDVAIDVGAGLLLRLQPDERRLPVRWTALTAREAGPAMHALRAAAYASAPGVAPGPDGLRLRR